MKGRILIVEDDPTIAMALRDRLKNEGYQPECVQNGLEGLKKSVDVRRDLIILDVMLPGKDGLEVCRDIRARGVETPILMLTARGETVDKVVGLKMGADDYLTKPFEMIELLARVETLLRRRGKPLRPDDVHEIGAFKLDTQRGELRRDREWIPLTIYPSSQIIFQNYVDRLTISL